MTQFEDQASQELYEKNLITESQFQEIKEYRSLNIFSLNVDDCWQDCEKRSSTTNFTPIIREIFYLQKCFKCFFCALVDRNLVLLINTAVIRKGLSNRVGVILL